jgi:hypothetical protein
MSDIDSVLAELESLAAEARAARASFAKSERELMALLDAARAAAVGVFGVPGRHAEVLRCVVDNKDAFETSAMSLTDLQVAIGRSRKSVRLSIEWLKGAGMVERSGRKMTVTKKGLAASSGSPKTRKMQGPQM